MNYNHIFHAGNFADVLKHSILVCILNALLDHRKPFFVLDTHSGRGRYNLSASEAMRSKESHEGILALQHSMQKSVQIPEFIKPYLDVVSAFNMPDKMRIYPGSPAIIHKFLRAADKAAFCELSEKEFFKLHALFHNDARIKTIRGDGYEALMSFLPPKEKHGLILIDPPFEKKDEILTLENAIIKSLSKWSDGIFMLWYPVKDYIPFDNHLNKLRDISKKPVELFTLSLPEHLARTQTSLRETAVVVINPPESLVKQKQEIQNLAHIMYQNQQESCVK